MRASVRSMRGRVETSSNNPVLQKLASMRLRANIEMIKLVYDIDYVSTSYFLEDYTEKTFLEE